MNKMIGKIEITSTLETKTGMHIGGTTEFAAIGAIDSPVIRDTLTRLPMIPGSTLKGKMRTLLSRQYSDKYMPVDFKNDSVIVKRLFGDADDMKYRNSRLQFIDSVMYNADEIAQRGLSRPTEVKFENTIKRLTAEANPRQIERVIPGCKFKISIIYNIISEADVNSKELAAEIEEDFKALRMGFELIEYDYIGGSGTRGYGKVKFSDTSVKKVFGDIDEAIVESCARIMGE